MAKGEVDPVDLVAFWPFMLAGLVSLGLVGAPSALGVSLADALISGAGSEITLATLVSLLSFSAAVVTNDWTRGPWGAVNLYLVVATALLILAPPLIPLFGEILANDLLAFVSFAIQSAGYSAVSYVG
jgi:hypothetical protein